MATPVVVVHCAGARLPHPASSGNGRRSWAWPSPGADRSPFFARIWVGWACSSPDRTRAVQRRCSARMQRITGATALERDSGRGEPTRRAAVMGKMIECAVHHGGLRRMLRRSARRSHALDRYSARCSVLDQRRRADGVIAMRGLFFPVRSRYRRCPGEMPEGLAFI